LEDETGEGSFLISDRGAGFDSVFFPSGAGGGGDSFISFKADCVTSGTPHRMQDVNFS